ncbi:hypothetical protein [Vibrio tritonius]|uniref:hypothetical protein n=1 Tax=Vibrio tritonius TaxID=1435069 RepID=UPI00315C54BB
MQTSELHQRAQVKLNDGRNGIPFQRHWAQKQHIEVTWVYQYFRCKHANTSVFSKC